MQRADGKTRRRIALPLVSVALCLVLTTGCNNTNPSGELQASVRTHVSDIPVPNGYDLVEKRSRSYRNQTGLRWVDYLYKGSGEKFDVVRFYEKQMVVFHWDPQTKQTAQGMTTLDFAKDHEHGRITVSGGGALSPTYVHVSITPGTHVGPPAKAKK